MKKLIILLTVSLIILTSCGSEPSEIKLGMLTRLNASEENFGAFMREVEESLKVKVASHVPIFYDNLSSMEAALQSGQVDELSTYVSVARYMTAKEPRFEVLKDHSLEFIDSFCFALREDETELAHSLNMAIKDMTADGTLDKLIKEYITEGNTTAVEIPYKEGLPTVKVAVTGDLPPLDYVSAEGKAAGFNTAVLSEIGKRLSRNIEPINIESGARSAALSSGQVDVVFWAIVPISEIIPDDTDKPDGVILTAPYYKDKIVHVKWN